jgi:hypothetical protein
MNGIVLRIMLVISVFIFNPASAALVFTFNPEPLTATTDTVLTIKSGWRERIQIFPSSDPGFNANIVVNGNIVNLDVVGGNGQIFFPDIFTHVITLGNFPPGNYQLRLRYRDQPTQVGFAGFLNPGVAATANFTVKPGPMLVTQVPALATSSSTILSLLILGLGVFAVRRR